MRVLMQTVTSPTLTEDPSQLDPVLQTEGWQTLMTFTLEHARMYTYSLLFLALLIPS
jgi:nuclear protein localization protein 4 homolog